MLREGGKRRPAKAVPRGAHAWSCILHPALRGLRCKEDCTWKCCVHLGGIIECFIHHSAAVFSCKKKKKKKQQQQKSENPVGGGREGSVLQWKRSGWEPSPHCTSAVLHPVQEALPCACRAAARLVCSGPWCVVLLCVPADTPSKDGLGFFPQISTLIDSPATVPPSHLSVLKSSDFDSVPQNSSIFSFW